VKRSGWNPTRRNRNIGTAKSGHGLANRLVIPAPWNDPRVFWEKLHEPVAIEINGFTILVEPCLPGFVHSVTVDDLVRMLGLLPPHDIAALRTVVLRQPTRKQGVLAAVWGRLAYFADFGRARGPAIILDAQRLAGCLEWGRHLSPDVAEELERLRTDGHTVTGENRRWRIQTSMVSTRSTQLFRTVPHELGHHVQYDREVRQRAGGDMDAELALRDHYFTKPAREKEDFAHRYARETMERLSAEHRVPFPRLVEETSMKRWCLEPKWFGLA